jgi:hypothetical protein
MRVGDGLKRGDPTKTGQFGLGFNSCYHFLNAVLDSEHKIFMTQEIRDEWAEELAKVRAHQKGEQKEWKEVRDKGLRLTPYGAPVPASEVENI